MGDADHGHALFGQLDHRIQHFLDHFRVKGAGRLVKQHDARFHAQGSRDGDALLLPARKLAWILQRLLWNLYLFQKIHRRFLGLALGDLADPDRGKGQVFKDRQMRKQVEVLENHAHFGPNLVDVLDIIRQLGAVDDDLTRLMLFQTVDAADQR